MPGYGFGCYKAHGDELVNAMSAAWKDGYRLYDTAAYYENEQTMARELASWQESEYFLISKIWPTDFDDPVAALDKSLARLGRDYLDACLLHWPGTDEKRMLSAWEKLMAQTDKIRTLGVSNFLQVHLEAIHAAFGVWPALNQIEIHPWWQERDLCGFCAARNIAVMAWSPLGRGTELDDQTIKAIAAELGREPAQVILRWHIQENHVPIPKSVHPDRIAANADVFDFELNDSQMAAIRALNRPDGKRGADPLTFNG